MRIYLIRHGQTDWNLAGKVQGKTDIMLNEAGLYQARLLAHAMKDRPVARIFTSCLNRAWQTGQVVAAQHHAPVTLVPDLNEVDFGLWEGKTWSDIERDYPEDFSAWVENPVEHRPTGGESQADAMGRCILAMGKIFATLDQEREDGDIAVVSHGAILAFLLTYLISADERREAMIVKNASITTVEYDRGTALGKLMELNEERHLEN